MSDMLGIDFPELVALLALGGLTWLLETLAAVLDRSGPIRLRHWAEEAAGRLRTTHENSARFGVFRFLISVLAKAASVVLVLTALRAVADEGEPVGLLSLAGLGLGVVGLLAASEIFSRRLVATRAEKILRRLTPLYRGLEFLLGPWVRLGARLVSAAEPEGAAGEEDEASDEEIEAFLDVGAREGILEPGEEDMILRVIDFGDAVVKSVMTPRIDMVGADVETGLEELSRTFLEGGHSRVPLYRGSIDNVVGILHLRELLHAQSDGAGHSPATRALPPYVVPETKRLDELLRELQSRRQQMAIVVDEFGGTAGLVTIEDLLEEIVGEIVDEHEPVHSDSEALSDGSWRIEGMTTLAAVADLFDVDLEQEPYETVGGMIFGCLGDVPQPGSEVEIRGLRFVVEKVEDRRIQSLRVWPRPSGELDAD